MTLARIIAVVRLAIVPLAVVKIVLDREGFPDGYEAAAWAVLAAHAVVAVALFILTSRRRARTRLLVILSVLADTALATAWMFVFAWEPGQPLRSLLFLVVVEAAVFFRFRVGLLVGALTLPILYAFEWWREEQFGITPRYDALALRVLVALALGGVVGRLVDMERGQAHAAEARAAEAERLRDELGRRVDVLEATSRAARALSSSLDLDEAFTAFVQELRGVLRFDRAAILFADGGGARVMATSGVGASDYLAPGSEIGLADSVLEDVIEHGATVYRDDIAEARSPVSTRIPAPSAPRMRGFGTEGSPFRTQRSRWLSEAARSAISTSPGPATGSGASSYRSTSGPPSSWMRIAFMCTILS